MKKIIFSFLLISSMTLISQTSTLPANMEEYISKKNTHSILYNPSHWIPDTASTGWDKEFNDSYNLVTAYFSAFDYFIPEAKIKETIKSQYSDFGKVKNLKIYPKTINGLNVNYFECELNYKDYDYRYEGFLYNARSGTVELTFGGQVESIKISRELIDEFCNGFKEIKK